MQKYHPSVAQVLQFFAFRHLPPELAAISSEFYDLAVATADRYPFSVETTHALRALLEAKDCAVRAALDKCSNVGREKT